MKLFLRLCTAGLLSIGIAWLLSLLPLLENKTPGGAGELTVFRNMKPIALSDDNLVDWIIDMPARIDLSRVEWKHRILALDFSMNDKQASDTVFAQLSESVYIGFAGTSNVERVMIRVYDQSDAGVGKKRLLVALDASRDRFSPDEYERINTGQLKAEGWLNNRFDLLKTSQWIERKVQQKTI